MKKRAHNSTGKRLGILLCIAALCSVLLLSTSCGAKYANSEYVGKWKATSASMSGISVNVEKVIGDFVLELKDDGSDKVTIGKDSAKGDWEETDKGIKLKDSKDELEFKKESKGKMSMNYSGMKLVFEKQ